jgi:hypothetical protein
VFSNCEFILGENDSIVIIVPTQIPKGLPITLEVHRDKIVFLSGEQQVGNMVCGRLDILQRIVSKAKVGLIEFLNGVPKFPAYISAVANVSVASEAA